jgi:hypothetical protein
MDATKHGGVLVSMVAGLAMLAGCADAEMVAAPKSGGYAPSAPPPPAASYAPREADAPAQLGEAEAPAARPTDSSWSRSRPADKRAEEKKEGPRVDRPGLGTEWGETRTSGISRVSFERADPRSPFTALALNYNDREGANAMASASRESVGSFDLASGLVTVSLKDEHGRLFRGFVSGQRDYVIGEAGRRYTIVLHNNTDHRLEAVLSVDGLDVMDGKAASFEKRGYILDPRGDLEVDGFRQSTETVAAFRFGSVRGSYAGQKTGDTRNVGVIGVALFHELGSAQPVWSNEEIRRRRSANPFPGEFATPPGQ